MKILGNLFARYRSPLVKEVSVFCLADFSCLRAPQIKAFCRRETKISLNTSTDENIKELTTFSYSSLSLASTTVGTRSIESISIAFCSHDLVGSGKAAGGRKGFARGKTPTGSLGFLAGGTLLAIVVDAVELAIRLRSIKEKLIEQEQKHLSIEIRSYLSKDY